MAQTTIAVVGAGIVGCLVAREISVRDPEAAVVVLDRDAIGSGATRRSAGLHFPRGATPRVRAMAAYSEDYYRQLTSDIASLPIHSLDMWVLAAEANAAGVREAYLDRAGLKRVVGVPFRPVEVPPGVAVWRGDGCQYADVYALAGAIARELRPRVLFREGARVVDLRADEQVAVVRLETGEELTVDRVVLAPGPWLAEPAWRDVVAPLGLRVKKVVALHVDRPPSEGDPAIVFHDEDAFLLPLAHRGHWLFSYTCQEWDADPDQAAPGVQAHHLAEARAILARYAPSLVDRCTSGRVFCDAYTPDRQPLVRAIGPAGRIVFAGGANGSGYRLAPALAAEVVDQLDLKGDS